MKTLYAAVAAVALLPAAAAANDRTASGSSNGLSWEASSTVVGQNGTGTAAAGGNPAYFAPNSAGYSGVVGLRMEYANGSAFVCSGSLMTGGRILTAAHCVSDGSGQAAGLVKTTAYFYNGVSQGDDHFVYPTVGVPTQPGVTAIDVGAYNIHKDYTGEVIDQNDIAVLWLKEAAPAYAQTYELYDNGDLTGEGFNVAGYGNRSVTGGIDGTTGPGAGAGVGRRRQGNNIYDYALGDAAFNGFFTDIIGGTNFFGTTAEIEFSYISDFDNGTAAQSQACRIASAPNVAGAAVAQARGFCTNGVGPLEVGIAGGDSGGPAFINGQIASVNSYSLSFGTGFGDIKTGLQSSFGELNGFVPTFIHTNFINAVPEPGTWAMMILGFGFVGGALRRRGQRQLSYA